METRRCARSGLPRFHGVIRLERMRVYRGGRRGGGGERDRRDRLAGDELITRRGRVGPDSAQSLSCFSFHCGASLRNSKASTRTDG